MTVDVPKPIASYFAAKNERDADAATRCFASDATVLDEGRTMAGATAIREWAMETMRKYQYRIEPLRVSRQRDKTIVTSRATGNFPGSPVDLRFVFAVKEDKIASLQVLA
ncbi:MAG: nuclear transport factor 2 family protein [Betaproteobacteria bacterium]|nr:nuclear transport factor 2 family protein [Betaproteobacteria bacterium]